MKEKKKINLMELQAVSIGAIAVEEKERLCKSILRKDSL